MDLVSIVIPTYNRHASLERALRSALRQASGERFTVEVIVVDNSPEANAAPVVRAVAGATASLRFLHEPRTGVANARNAGVADARGRWVAFLDDDEEAAPGWIACLVETARKTGADAVFGPVTAQADGGGEIGPLAPYFSRCIDRPDGADITELVAYLGTNNSMFDRERCLKGGRTFETSLNESGGEDSLLLRQLVLGGRRFAWSAQAGVIEWAAQKRLNWAYVRKRKFLSGQIRVFVNQMIGPRHWIVIPGWMAIGLAQFVAGHVLAWTLWLVDPVKSEKAAATASGGLGKVLWATRFRPALYGKGLVS